mmetsp:Transcript_34045/g.101270  ORF Transcript_34045/g.101270 Transcript_34045/m.101270 type:complete len:378 (+) Transcript_34045:640-1773(+)
MGMSALRASSSSPMMALRSTPADEIMTSCGRGSVYARTPPSISSFQVPGVNLGLGIPLNSKRLRTRPNLAMFEGSSGKPLGSDCARLTGTKLCQGSMIFVHCPATVSKVAWYVDSGLSSCSCVLILSLNVEPLPRTRSARPSVPDRLVSIRTVRQPQKPPPSMIRSPFHVAPLTPPSSRSSNDDELIPPMITSSMRSHLARSSSVTIGSTSLTTICAFFRCFGRTAASAALPPASTRSGLMPSMNPIEPSGCGPNTEPSSDTTCVTPLHRSALSSVSCRVTSTPALMNRMPFPSFCLPGWTPTSSYTFRAFSSDRTAATTVRPLCSRARTTRLPTRPVAPSTITAFSRGSGGSAGAAGVAAGCGVTPSALSGLCDIW